MKIPTFVSAVFLILINFAGESEGLCENVNKEIQCQSVSVISSRVIDKVPGVSEATRLSIQFNSDLEILGRSFGSAVKLQKVIVHYNKIDKIFADTFTDLPVNYLGLGHNGINSIYPGAFSNLTLLKKLRLEDNNLKEVPKGLFTNLPVEELVLSKNKIQTLENSVLENLPNLKKLKLDNNKLKSIFVHRVVTHPERLELLWLYNNSLTAVTNYMLQHLQNLKVLNIGFNSITTIEVNAFEQIPNLQYLVLRNNLLKEVDGSIFPKMGMPHLESIYLDSNRLMFLSSNFFVRLGSLRKITLVGNPWLCACLTEVHDLLLQNNIKEKCYEDYTNGQRPICVTDKAGETVCRLVYNTELSEKYVAFEEDYPLKKTAISCIL